MDGKKKLTALAIGLIILGGGDLLHISTTTLALMAGLIATYIGAQGVADVGKARAQIEANSLCCDDCLTGTYPTQPASPSHESPPTPAP